MKTGLEGVISISPVTGGPSRIGIANSRPLPDTEFEVARDGTTVGSFKTDEHGHFENSLPPGHYTVSKKGGQPRIGNFGPFQVDIVPGQITRVEWICDSGMR